MSQKGWIIYLQTKNTKLALELQKKALSLKNDIAEYYLRAGLLYWELSGEFRTDKQYSHNHFLQAAKIDTSLSTAFTYLGHYYLQIEKDIERAKKCYLKALNLNSFEENAGKNLRDIYLSNKQEALAISLYQDITKKSLQVHWAWLGLAVHQQRQQQYLF